MSLVNFNYELEIVNAEAPVALRKRFSLTSLTQFHDQAFTLATATNKIIANFGSASGDDLPDADFIFIIVDQDVTVEFIGTATADNSNLRIKANVPFILGLDDTLAYNALGAFAGAAQNITKITIRNASGTTLNGRIIAAT